MDELKKKIKDNHCFVQSLKLAIQGRVVDATIQGAFVWVTDSNTRRHKQYIITAKLCYHNNTMQVRGVSNCSMVEAWTKVLQEIK